MISAATQNQPKEAFRGHYKADRASVVTNSHFTARATNLARSNNVELMDREWLTRTILGASRNQALQPHR